MKHIVKRAGHTEKFDQRKLYASVYAACLAVRVSVREAELIADQVTSDVINDMSSKYEVTSKDIFTRCYKFLAMYNEDASYIYKHSHSLR